METREKSVKERKNKMWYFFNVLYEHNKDMYNSPDANFDENNDDAREREPII
jgi:hypothetical protein